MNERSATPVLDDLIDRMAPDDYLAADCLDSTDPDAWDRLLGRYSRLILTVIRRYHLSPEDAADVYQEVWLTCWRELPTLRDRARLGPWLAKVACRHAWDARRRLISGTAEMTPREDADALPALERIPHDAPGPDEVVTRSEVVKYVREAVAQLPARQRELMTALFFEDGSYAEIALRLGYSIDSIGAIRGRCFRALRDILHELEVR